MESNSASLIVKFKAINGSYLQRRGEVEVIEMSEAEEVKEMSKEEEVRIQCPCGRYIDSPSEYKLLYLKKEMNEIDILCPNDACFLRELGFVKFEVDDAGRLKVTSASFYPPFVTWNTARLGTEVAVRLLKEHLRAIVQRYIDWKRVKEDVLKRRKEAEERERKEKEEQG